MGRVHSFSKCLIFVCGLAFGMVTMFILEHNHNMQYFHGYFEEPAGQTSNLVIQRNSGKLKAAADKNNLPKHFMSIMNTTQDKGKKPRLLCWIMTNQTNFRRAKSISDTWGKRCDTLLFLSSKADPRLPAIGLDVEEGPNKLFDKTRASLDYIYHHYLNDADWFLKADDDTYVIIENLRYMLSKLNTSDPHYLGRMIANRRCGYNGGGAGYVFSRETLRRFKKALGESSCPKHFRFEDLAVGICLRAQGVRPVSTRDSSDRETFMHFTPGMHLYGRTPQWMKKLNYPLPRKQGTECCSDYPNTFHKIMPEMMHQLEYSIYRVKVRS